MREHIFGFNIKTDQISTVKRICRRYGFEVSKKGEELLIKPYQPACLGDFSFLIADLYLAGIPLPSELQKEAEEVVRDCGI